MCWINSQSKNLIHLKYLILETPYTFFSIFSRYFSFRHSKHQLYDMYEQQQPLLFCLKDVKKM